jgi:DNA-binding NarL/FixJ family response regulator
MKKISVLIADDHKLLREALSLVIDGDPGFKVIAACENSQDAIEITTREKPAIVLMDINIAPISGIEATQKIKLLCPSAMVIGMSVHSEPVYVRKMLKMGARGYVTKNSPRDEIINAMKRVNNGEIYVCDEIKNILGQQLGDDALPAPGLHSLTGREIQIVELIRKGLPSREIATAICVTIKTVEVHRHNILRKLKLKNTPSLVNFAHNNALSSLTGLSV